MNRKLRLLLGSAAGLFLLATALYCLNDVYSVSSISRFSSQFQQKHQKEKEQSTTEALSSLTISNGTILNAKHIEPFVKAILNSSATEPPRLKCPALRADRYDILRSSSKQERATEESSHIDFYFALDLRNCLPLLPRLLGSIVEAVQFLGPERCGLSIVEGNSPDGTGDVLRALQPFFEQLGLRYWYEESSLNPAAGERIPRLAELRNLALKPLLSNNGTASQQTTILFVNDVAACTEDLLELVLQRQRLNADMTCAMDWIGDRPVFYDSWVARTIEGDSFFEIPPDGSWDLAENLFPNSPAARARFQVKRPFQVFACWNGATAIGAGPILNGLRFRAPSRGECFQGEPQIFCKDLWFRGYRKIAVVPTVNLEYTNEGGAFIKQVKGYTSGWTDNEDEEEKPIDWVFEPPEQVKCMPTWTTQYWSEWNETLT